MNSYLFKIVGPNIDELPNKHCIDDIAAMELASKTVAQYPLNTSIEIIRLNEVDGMEQRQWIAKYEHVVRRTF